MHVSFTIFVVGYTGGGTTGLHFRKPVFNGLGIEFVVSRFIISEPKPSHQHGEPGKISFHVKSPVCRQLAVRFREMILKGVYQNDDALPSIRQIASEQRINSITVYKAYQKPWWTMILWERGLGIYLDEGAREQLLGDERSVFIDSELPEFQNSTQRLGFILKDFLEEVS